MIRDGLVLTPDGLVAADVAVLGSRVSEIGVGLDARGAMEVDARGCLVGPGLVDIHTHLREPGQTWKEDLESGSRAALAGGFTAVVAMPNTEPPIDDADLMADLYLRAQSIRPFEIHFAGALTEGRRGSESSDLPGMYEVGARIFTDDGGCVDEASVVEDLMVLIASLPGAVFAQHAELSTLTTDGHMNDGPVAERLGVGGLPADAESRIVARDLELVQRTGASYHCQHVSAADTVDLIRAAKEQGLPVTAEVTPHHLDFTEDHAETLDPNFKMYPPLRREEDRSALRSALLDGTIDVVATDHAPHSVAEKGVEFSRAPRGVIGLETAAAAVWASVGDPQRFFDVLSTRPAQIARLGSQGQLIRPGAPANLVVFDPEHRWTPGPFFSKSSNSPYLGRHMTGIVVATIAAGELMHHLEPGRL